LNLKDFGMSRILRTTDEGKVRSVPNNSINQNSIQNEIIEYEDNDPTIFDVVDEQ
jgi:hypothetical protein